MEPRKVEEMGVDNNVLHLRGLLATYRLSKEQDSFRRFQRV